MCQTSHITFFFVNVISFFLNNIYNIHFVGCCGNKLSLPLFPFVRGEVLPATSLRSKIDAN